MFPKKIISGGQTGVDRGALDFAINQGIRHGGWCPLGRKAEDGVIPDLYLLNETASSDYLERTRMNIETAGATLILTSPYFTPGTAQTIKLCAASGKPWWTETLFKVDRNRIAKWLREVHPRTLNVAGPRESKCSGAQQEACRVLADVYHLLSDDLQT